jgi:acetyltransferase-like isoleucine patch superfamily enzyme
MMGPGRTLEWDWFPGTIPENVWVEESAYVETTFSFFLYRSQAPVGVRIGRGASTYLGTMFDVGPRGRVSIGDFALVNGARIICEDQVEIGDYALISWNVVLMDSYRVSLDPGERRKEIERMPRSLPYFLNGGSDPRPVRIGRNVWIGFDACVLPGVSIGDGSVVGARSVVVEAVPPYTVVAGNPARVVRQLESEEITDGSARTA